jgi:hypothetical protein
MTKPQRPKDLICAISAKEPVRNGSEILQVVELLSEWHFPNQHLAYSEKWTANLKWRRFLGRRASLGMTFGFETASSE